MYPRSLTGLLAAFVLTTVPVIAHGQTGRRNDVAVAWQTAQQIEQQINAHFSIQRQDIDSLAGLQLPYPFSGVRWRAEQDSQVQVVNDSLLAYVRARLATAEPRPYANLVDTATTLLHAMQLAHDVGDSAAFLEFPSHVQRLQEIQGELQPARPYKPQVLQDSTVRTRVQAYGDVVRAKMAALDSTQAKWLPIGRQQVFATSWQQAEQIKQEIARDFSVQPWELSNLERQQFPYWPYRLQREVEQSPQVQAASDSLLTHVNARLNNLKLQYASLLDTATSLLQAMQTTWDRGDSATLASQVPRLQEIQHSLEPIAQAKTQALRDPAVRKYVQAYGQVVMARMVAIDPTQAKWLPILQRLFTVQQHVSEVQQNAWQDSAVQQRMKGYTQAYQTMVLAKMAAIDSTVPKGMTWSDIPQRLAKVRQQAEQDPEVQKRINLLAQSYQKVVRAKVAEIDPRTPQLSKWLQIAQPFSNLPQRAAQDPTVQAAVDSLQSVRLEMVGGRP